MRANTPTQQLYHPHTPNHIHYPHTNTVTMVLGSQLLDNPLVGMALYSGTIFAFFFVALFGGTSRIRLVRVLHKFLTGGCCSMFG